MTQPPPPQQPSPYEQPYQYQQQPPQYQQPSQYAQDPYAPQGQYGTPPQQGWGQPPAYQPPPPSGTNGFAIASLVFGIIGGILFGLIFGIIALVQTKKTGQKGRGLAIAGLALTGAWIALLGIVIVAAIITGDDNANRDAGGQLTTGGSVAATDLAVGDCLNGLEDGKEFTDVPAVPCAQPHEGEVFAVFNLSGGSWPGEATVSKKSEDGCNQRLQTFAPKAVDDPKVSLYSLQPTESTWARGDREVTCIAVTETKVTGSVKD